MAVEKLKILGCEDSSVVEHFPRLEYPREMGAR